MRPPRKYLFWLLLFLVVFPSVLAVEIILPRSEYSGNELLSIAIEDCSGISTVRISNPEPQLIFVDQGASGWTSQYHTASDPSSGKYVITVSCADGTTADQSFCANAPGCLAAAASGNTGNNQTTTSSSGGGRGRYCPADWSCSAWSYCNSTLQQARSCVDRASCEQPTTEVQACASCQESWICDEWLECQSGIQHRLCRDVHNCGTTTLKPTLQQNCQATASSQPGIVPSSPPLPPTPPTPPTLQQPSFWKQYQTYFIAVPASVIVLFLLLALIVHIVHVRQPALNFDELQDWVAQEHHMGLSDDQIRAALRSTEWKDAEINKALGQ